MTKVISAPKSGEALLFSKGGLAPDLLADNALIISRELKQRPRVNGHVIVFANEKGGVGKSTVAFHTIVALCNEGHSVSALDLDSRQQTLSHALENREGTSRRLNVKLPQPNRVTIKNQTGAELAQEIARIGGNSDFIIIDVAGHDTPMARRAIAMADTLVTPINNSFVDIDLLGRYDPFTLKLKSFGHFATLVRELREVREYQNRPPTDWIVLQNRLRSTNSQNQSRIAEALEDLAPKAGFRLAQGLGERVAYRDLFLLGLTLFDMRFLPEFAKTRGVAKIELAQLIADLKLPAYAGI